MADNIQLYPYMSTPSGIEVCFSRNGGAIEQRRFPPGTSREKIMAALAGKSCSEQDGMAEAMARIALEKFKRAAESQPVHTQSEEDLKSSDQAKDNKIGELNRMRSALKAAKVKGYQLFKENTLREKYAELLDKQKMNKGEANA